MKVCEDDNNNIASLHKLGIHNRVRNALKLWLQINIAMAKRSILLRLSPPLGACHSSRRSRLLQAWNKIILILTILLIIIRHKLRLHRPVSASSNRLFKGVQSRLVHLVLTMNYGKNTFKRKWKKQNIITYATWNVRGQPTKKRNCNKMTKIKRI
jgi:hypothetical protein